MLRLDDDDDALRIEDLVNGVGDLRGQALLHLGAARIALDEAQLAEIFKDVVKAPERPVWNYQSDAAVPGALMGNPVGVNSAESSATDAVAAPDLDAPANENEEQA